MEYNKLYLEKKLHINSIISIHYFEYTNDFVFSGESHNFWEFLYVDKGEVLVEADNVVSSLKKGEIIFHKPNEFHNVSANGKIAPNLIVISFECNSKDMLFFENKKFFLSENQQKILATIIAESKACFSSVIDNPYLNLLEISENEPFASQQIINLMLELFLINIVRINSSNKLQSTPRITPNKKINNLNILNIYNNILYYLEQNICNQLSIDKIAKDNFIGRSQLQKIFKEHSNIGIIEYFSNMKIDEAKLLIRTNQMNFTQIANYLGYNSIHYFSRQFKKYTGMTPSQYASSVKCISDNVHKGI